MTKIMAIERSKFAPRLFLRLITLPLIMWDSVMSDNCTLDPANTTLDCWDISQFPVGRYNEITNLKCKNCVIETLTASVFGDNEFKHLELVIILNSYVKIIDLNAFSTTRNILELHLDGNRLTAIHVYTFAYLESLHHLSLKYNKIGTIDSDTFDHMKLLETLDLSLNNISQLKSSFIKFTSISVLNLSGNPVQFSEIGAILESSSLRNLYLQSCNLKDIPINAFDKLPGLMSLDLSKNLITVFPDNSMKKLECLEHLDLSYNRLKVISITMFPESSKLESLLCNNISLNITRKCEKILDAIGNKDINSNENFTIIEPPLNNLKEVVNTTEPHKKVTEGAISYIEISCLVLFLLFVIYHIRRLRRDHIANFDEDQFI